MLCIKWFSLIFSLKKVKNRILIKGLSLTKVYFYNEIKIVSIRITLIEMNFKKT